MAITAMSCKPSISTVIFAGGQGRRIGGGKAMLLLAGESLFGRSLTKAAKYSHDVAVAAGRDIELPVPADMTLLVDQTPDAGPIAGLSSALQFAAVRNEAYVLVIPCDTPFLPRDLLDRLRGSIGRKAVALAQSDGRLHSACALWRADVVIALPDYIATGRRSLIGFAEAIGYMAVGWECDVVDPFFNINTAEDLAEAEAYLVRTPYLA